jgi:hypothetical protein
MTLPSSGPISLLDVRTELGLSGTISLNDTAVRNLLGKVSGIISLFDAYGKTYIPPPGVPGDPYYTSVTQTSATINWTAGSNATSYEVYYWWNATWTYLGSSTVLYYYVSGLSSNAAYYFKIRSVNASGTADSNFTTLNTLPYAPGVPGTPTYTNIGRSNVTINWTASSGVVDYYYIMRWNGTTWVYEGTSIATNWTDNLLTPNTTYYFYIVAFNAGGNTAGSWSSVTTLL